MWPDEATVVACIDNVKENVDNVNDEHFQRDIDENSHHERDIDENFHHERDIDENFHDEWPVTHGNDKYSPSSSASTDISPGMSWSRSTSHAAFSPQVSATVARLWSASSITASNNVNSPAVAAIVAPSMSPASNSGSINQITFNLSPVNSPSHSANVSQRGSRRGSSSSPIDDNSNCGDAEKAASVTKQGEELDPAPTDSTAELTPSDSTTDKRAPTDSTTTDAVPTDSVTNPTDRADGSDRRRDSDQPRDMHRDTHDVAMENGIEEVDGVQVADTSDVGIAIRGGRDVRIVMHGGGGVRIEMLQGSSAETAVSDSRQQNLDSRQQDAGSIQQQNANTRQENIDNRQQETPESIQQQNADNRQHNAESRSHVRKRQVVIIVLVSVCMVFLSGNIVAWIYVKKLQSKPKKEGDNTENSDDDIVKHVDNNEVIVTAVGEDVLNKFSVDEVDRSEDKVYESNTEETLRNDTNTRREGRESKSNAQREGLKSNTQNSGPIEAMEKSLTKSSDKESSKETKKNSPRLLAAGATVGGVAAGALAGFLSLPKLNPRLRQSTTLSDGQSTASAEEGGRRVGTSNAASTLRNNLSNTVVQNNSPNSASADLHISTVSDSPPPVTHAIDPIESVPEFFGTNLVQDFETSLVPETRTLPPETRTLPPETSTRPPETRTLPVTNTPPPETSTRPPETRTLPVTSTLPPELPTTLPPEPKTRVDKSKVTVKESKDNRGWLMRETSFRIRDFSVKDFRQKFISENSPIAIWKPEFDKGGTLKWTEDPERFPKKASTGSSEVDSVSGAESVSNNKAWLLERSSTTLSTLDTSRRLDRVSTLDTVRKLDSARKRLERNEESSEEPKELEEIESEAAPSESKTEADLVSYKIHAAIEDDRKEAGFLRITSQLSEVLKYSEFEKETTRAFKISRLASTEFVNIGGLKVWEPFTVQTVLEGEEETYNNSQNSEEIGEERKDLLITKWEQRIGDGKTKDWAVKMAMKNLTQSWKDQVQGMIGHLNSTS